MKYLILALMLAISNAQAWNDKNDTKKQKAERIAKRHPQGSGIGSNKYNVRYDRNYKVDKYKRNYKD